MMLLSQAKNDCGGRRIAAALYAQKADVSVNKMWGLDDFIKAIKVYADGSAGQV